jgi:Rad3-related DNA helicase
VRSRLCVRRLARLLHEVIDSHNEALINWQHLDAAVKQGHDDADTIRNLNLTKFELTFHNNLVERLTGLGLETEDELALVIPPPDSPPTTPERTQEQNRTDTGSEPSRKRSRPSHVIAD